MGRAMHIPPFTQARGRKSGNRMGERWEKPRNTHPSPRQGVKDDHRQNTPHPSSITHKKTPPNQGVPNIPIKTDC
ncbi:hypothetical protein CYL18_17610 [Pradoshia eiseniae]|uniref:Uncharacterized protein n=1 Tax=Pradoshia eiseniae TaxID=2064768 RepID=A0A2S7MVK0_9BACI|nr:hypothetical protein CYL18_17610 [Pradoshia eiseniae]